MAQRNPRNQRYVSEEHKGSSRRSAGSAKPVRKAGESVYVPSAKQLEKKREKQEKTRDEQTEKQDRERRSAMIAGISKLPEYKKWRQIWWICLILAIIGVGLSWAVSYFSKNGSLPSFLTPATPVFMYGGLIVGYGAIIVALVIDFRKIRPIRKAQEAKARTLSKKQKHELDEAIKTNKANKTNKTWQPVRPKWWSIIGKPKDASAVPGEDEAESDEKKRK